MTSFRPNPLIAAAAPDRQATATRANDACLDCGAHVSTYNCNRSLIAERPEGAREDWWQACDNADCEHAYGEGIFQSDADWVADRQAAICSLRGLVAHIRASIQIEGAGGFYGADELARKEAALALAIGAKG